MSATKWLLLPLAVVSCHGSLAASEAGGTPPGQVALSAAEAAAAKIEVAPVGEQVVDDALVTGGTVVLDDLRTGHVYSPVTGRVAKIMAELGQRVKKGEPLATIESPDISTAVSDVHKAEAALIGAQHDLRRKRDLLAQNAASQADVEASEDAERNARAEIERARLKQYLLRVGNVDAVTGMYTLPAPIDGEVLLRSITPGIEVQGQYSGGTSVTTVGSLAATANPGELFTIGELDRVWVLGDVYEIDLARVHVGAPAQVTVVAYPDKLFRGTVDWVSGSLDPTTRTAKVRCTFDNPDKLLRPNMYSTVRITVDQRKALAIPRTAIVSLGEYKVVFVEIGESDGRMRYERLPVDVTEVQLAQWLEVKHGLEPGQKVVVSGAGALAQKL